MTAVHGKSSSNSGRSDQHELHHPKAYFHSCTHGRTAASDTARVLAANVFFLSRFCLSCGSYMLHCTLPCQPLTSIFTEDVAHTLVAQRLAQTQKLAVATDRKVSAERGSRPRAISTHSGSSPPRTGAWSSTTRAVSILSPRPAGRPVFLSFGPCC